MTTLSAQSQNRVRSFSGAARALALGALAFGLLGLAILAPPVRAERKASHAGWPTINGMLLINKAGQSRPLDARPLHDPFDGQDPSYRCDGVHTHQDCFIQAQACTPDARHHSVCAHDPVMPSHSVRHNELLGGHGDDTIHAGDAGDVIWGDYNATGQPLGQTDRLYGGPGADFLYASHGVNFIHTGGGSDIVHARYGGGDIYCDSSAAIVNLSKRSQKRYHLHDCSHVTLRPVGTEPA